MHSESDMISVEEARDRILAFFDRLPAERKPLLDGFRAAGVKHLFAGHYHRNAHGQDGDIEMVTTGPVGMPLGGARSGFRLVWVGPDRLQHEYFEFGALPNKAPAPPK